jgi:hypothetical protein
MQFSTPIQANLWTRYHQANEPKEKGQASNSSLLAMSERQSQRRYGNKPF